MVQRAQDTPRIDRCDIQSYSVVVEPTEGWWTNNAKFGQRFQGSLPPAEGQTINLIDNPRLPGPPRPWTVNLFRSNKNLANEVSPLQNADVRARITYGAGGASNTFDCDVVAGTQFQLVCNSIRVDLYGYNPCPSNGPYVPGPGLVVGALLGKGSANPQLPPTFTTEFFVAPGIAELAIPDFARGFGIHFQDRTQSQWAGTFASFTTPGISAKQVDFELFYTQLQQQGGLALPGGVNQLFIDTTAYAGSSTLMAVQWFLAL